MGLETLASLEAFGVGIAGYIVPFLFVLAIVVFFHELGHFLVGRWCGVKVQAFSIGFGPEIVGFFGSAVHNHLRLTLAIIAVLVLAGCWFWWTRKKNGRGDTAPAAL